MFDTLFGIFLVILGGAVGLLLLVLTIGMIRDMFPERKSVLEKRIDQLQNQIDQLENDLAEAQKALSQKDQEIKKAVECEKKKTVQKITELEEINEDLSRECSEMEDSLYSYEYENKELVENNRTLSNENLALQKKISKLESERIELRDENSGLMLEIKHNVEGRDPTPFPFQIDRALYQSGVNCGSLKKALSENIIDRFVDINQTKEIVSIRDSVSITPSEKSDRTDKYLTSLASCTCDDFGRRPDHACKHMFTLAMQLGILTVAGEPLTPPRKTK